MIFISVFNSEVYLRAYTEFVNIFINRIFKHNVNKLSWIDFQNIFFENKSLAKMIEFIYCQFQNIYPEIFANKSLHIDYYYFLKIFLKQYDYFLILFFRENKLVFNEYFTQMLYEPGKKILVDLFCEGYYSEYFDLSGIDFISLKDIKLKDDKLNINHLPPNMLFFKNKYKYKDKDNESILLLDSDYEYNSIRKLL